MCAYVTYSYYKSILFGFLYSYKPVGVGEKLNYTTVPNYVWSISAVCVTLAAVNIYMSLS